ncbi:hypothetical protein TNCV_3522831 [Trichonephila clavipes]|uniref:Uncharacterized protein n=1 Tax=Trichonephila clavipes TaxID=2585209 RepID=A0A8X6W9C0_TRICX|nr:hypothetical protein TNCV_3522831 [Trichonephila clavipes]
MGKEGIQLIFPTHMFAACSVPVIAPPGRAPHFEKHCCRVSAADNGRRIYPLDPHLDAAVLYSGSTPGKHRAWYLPIDRHTASLVELRGGVRCSRFTIAGLTAVKQSIEGIAKRISAEVPGHTGRNSGRSQGNWAFKKPSVPYLMYPSPLRKGIFVVGVFICCLRLSVIFNITGGGGKTGAMGFETLELALLLLLTAWVSEVFSIDGRSN